jgi:small subunit ribosomal protein S17
MTQARGNRRRLRGVVVSDKTAKTVVVEVVRHVRHPKYGKRVRQDTRMHVHDETDTAHLGDVVEIVECRPMSRLKHWRLERVIQRNPEAGLVSPEVAAEVKPV